MDREINSSEAIIFNFLNQELTEERFNFMRSAFHNAKNEDFVWSETDLEKNFKDVLEKPTEEIKDVDIIESEQQEDLLPSGVKIDSFELQGFRGQLQPFHQVLGSRDFFVSGDNASGKTTLADALYFFLRRRISWFQGEGSQDYKIRDIRHVSLPEEENAEVSVEFTSPKESFSGRLLLRGRGTTEYEPDNPLVEELDRLSGRFYIRHRLLLDFINKGNKEKWEEISELLGFEKLTKFQKRMALLERVTRRKVEEARKAFNNQKENLVRDAKRWSRTLNEDVLGKHLKTSLPEEFWDLDKDADPLKRSDTLWTKTFQTLSAVAGMPTGDPREALESLKDQYKPGETTNEKTELNALLQERLPLNASGTLKKIIDLNKRIQEWQKEESKIQELLMHATYHYLETAIDGSEVALDSCPICDNETYPDQKPITKETLLSKLKKRKKRGQKAKKEFEDEIRKISGIVDNSTREIKRAVKVFARNLLLLKMLSEIPYNDSNLAEVMEEFQNKEKWGSPLGITDIQDISSEDNVNETLEVLDYLQDLWTFAETLESTLEDIKESLKDSAQEGSNNNDLYEAATRLESARKEKQTWEDGEDAEQLQTKRKNKKLLEDRLEATEDADTVFTQMRNEVIEEAFDEISAMINKYFQKLYPDEGKVSNIAIEIDENNQAALICDYLEEKGINPATVLSEGQLYALGLCIFLASNRLLQGKAGFMVFDDVVPSFDSSKGRNLIKLLREDFDDRQIIFLTHDEHIHGNIKAVWGRYSEHLVLAPTDRSGLVPKEGLKNVSFLSPKGIVENSSMSNADKAAALGSWLERRIKILLSHLDNGDVRINLPWHSLRPTYAPMYDSLISYANEVNQKELSSLLAKPKLKDLTRLDRNDGVHGKRDFSDGDIADFANSAYQLMSIFRCQGCGALVKDLKHAICASGHQDEYGNLIPVKLKPKHWICSSCKEISHNFQNPTHADEDCDGEFRVEIIEE